MPGAADPYCDLALPCGFDPYCWMRKAEGREPSPQPGLKSALRQNSDSLAYGSWQALASTFDLKQRGGNDQQESYGFGGLYHSEPSKVTQPDTTATGSGRPPTEALEAASPRHQNMEAER